jgi:hypothetical protein
MAFGDYSNGYHKGYTRSPWNNERRTQAYNEGYEFEWAKLVKENGPVVLQDHRGELLYD